MKIKREVLLEELESVVAGLSPKINLAQSNCFAFKDGQVMTFNEEVACRRDTSLKIEGAITAVPFMAILRNLKDENLEINLTKNKLVIIGKNSKTGMSIEKEVELPIDAVESPTNWKPIDEEFLQAANMVRQCASNNEAEQKITCVHIHPNWVEASDNTQLTRYTLDTGLEESVLVKHNSIKYVVELGVNKLSLTDNWIHFKNPSNLVISCRRYMDQFPDLSKFLEVEGRKIALPKGLEYLVTNAEIFSAENSDQNVVLVEMIPPGILKIKGTGASGYHIGVKGGKAFKYKGDPIAFNIPPKLLIQITNEYNDVVINQKRMKVHNGKYEYVTCLGVPKNNKEDGNGDSRKESEEGEE